MWDWLKSRSLRRLAPDLGFVPAVLEAFHFLEAEFGFRVVAVEPPWRVRFESDISYLTVWQELGRDWGIDAEVGRLPQPGESATFYEVLGAALGADGAEGRSCAGQTPEAVRECVARLAADVRAHALPALRGETAAYAAAKAFGRPETARRTARDRAVWEERKAARRALEEHDWAEAVRRFEGILPHLSDDEREALARARARMAR